jgi:hypothetical protein
MKFLGVLGLVLLMLSSAVNAEYYIVYSPPPICHHCYAPPMARIVHHVKKTTVHMRHHQPNHHVRRHSSYHLSITYLGSDSYPNNPCAPTSCAYNACHSNCRNMNYSPDDNGIHENKYVRYYEPGFRDMDNPNLDQRTGDDVDYEY